MNFINWTAEMCFYRGGGGDSLQGAIGEGEIVNMIPMLYKEFYLNFMNRL